MFDAWIPSQSAKPAFLTPSGLSGPGPSVIESLSDSFHACSESVPRHAFAAFRLTFTVIVNTQPSTLYLSYHYLMPFTTDYRHHMYHKQPKRAISVVERSSPHDLGDVSAKWAQIWLCYIMIGLRDVVPPPAATSLRLLRRFECDSNLRSTYHTLHSSYSLF